MTPRILWQGTNFYPVPHFTHIDGNRPDSGAYRFSYWICKSIINIYRSNKHKCDVQKVHIFNYKHVSTMKSVCIYCYNMQSGSRHWRSLLTLGALYVMMLSVFCVYCKLYHTLMIFHWTTPWAARLLSLSLADLSSPCQRILILDSVANLLVRHMVFVGNVQSYNRAIS